MIIHFKIKHHKQDRTYKSSLKWAHKEGEDFIYPEFEGPDGDEVVGDRTYEGTPGQAACAKLMDALFDSPHSVSYSRTPDPDLRSQTLFISLPHFLFCTHPYLRTSAIPLFRMITDLSPFYCDL